MIVSKREPRVQPNIAPANVPTTKLITVATPISPTVHGTEASRMDRTGSPSVIETPRLPWNSWVRYVQY